MKELEKILENFLLLQMCPGLTHNRLYINDKNNYIGGDIFNVIDHILYLYYNEKNELQKDKYIIIYRDKFIYRHVKVIISDCTVNCYHDKETIYIKCSKNDIENKLYIDLFLSEIITIIEEECHKFDTTTNLNRYKKYVSDFLNELNIDYNNINYDKLIKEIKRTDLWKLCIKYGGRIGFLFYEEINKRKINNQTYVWPELYSEDIDKSIIININKPKLKKSLKSYLSESYNLYINESDYKYKDELSIIIKELLFHYNWNKSNIYIDMFVEKLVDIDTFEFLQLDSDKYIYTVKKILDELL